MPKLKNILKEEVSTEISQVLEEARSRSEKIVSEAQSQAASQLTARRRQNEAEARAAIQRARSAGNLTIAIARLQAKGEIIEQARKGAMAAIGEASLKPGYGDVLLALAEEAAGEIDAPEALVVHPDDKEKIEEWAARKGIELRTDPSLKLGVRISNRHGKTVENTLPERLNRAWDTVVSDVAKMLWVSED
jgi:V/A-type H+/Na+-transporting ATPase subunit E